MRSVRLDPELEERIKRAASLEGATVSEFLRTAAAERADRTLSEQGADRFADVLGVVRGGGGRAGDTGTAFREVLAEKRHKP